MAKMNPAIKKKWVAALRSGDYKQGTGKIRHKGRFCCLGVLCNIHAQMHPKIAAQQKNKSTYMGSETDYPPDELMAWAGFDWFDDYVLIAGRSETLATHNDDGRTFAEIADAIEAQL